MKKILVIAGGQWQVPIIKKCKERGLFVINTNLYEDSPGFKYADIGLVVDVLDKQKNLKIAKEYAVDAVITDQSDIAVRTVSYISENLGLNGIGIETANLFSNKLLMRMFCDEHGFPIPEYKECSRFEDLIDFIHQHHYPVIIKPLDNQSSRGVFKIEDQNELVSKFDETMSHSSGGSILIERYIEGQEFTVEGYMREGKHYSLAISQKFQLAHNPSVSKRILYKHADALYDYPNLRAQNDELVAKMRLPFGITHAEYKYSKGNFYLVEIAARGGGNLISSHIIPLMSNVDVNQCLINDALGITGPEIIPHKNSCFTSLEFFDFKPGRIKTIAGGDTIRDNPYVVDFMLNYAEGDTITMAHDDRSRHGHFICHHASEKGLNALIRDIRNSLIIEYE